MTRREFLQSLAILWAATKIPDLDGAPLTISETYGPILPGAEYGKAIQFKNLDDLDFVVRALKTDAVRTLPKGTAYILRAGKDLSNFGRYHIAAWYSGPGLETNRRFSSDGPDWALNQALGLYESPGVLIA